jgi:CubicO group peptidase (beta-lactamase class C family)
VKLDRIGLRLCVLAAALASTHATAQLRASTPAEQARDTVAFQGVTQAITSELPDVQSAVVVLRGRVLYEFYRDGSADTLREQQSVSKSALSVLAGIALGQGRIASLDQPVVALAPEWAPLNADPRAGAITVRHLLTMTAGFEVDDAAGTAAPLAPREAWARRLAANPGEKFAYDNSLVTMTMAAIEKAAGMPFVDYVRQQMVVPLAFKEPTYRRGFQARTIDMAKLGQLMLQDGVWEGKRLLPASFVAAATVAQNGGGPPVGLPYGYMWWIQRSEAPRKVYMASGYAGQFLWIDPAQHLVIAINSTVSPQSQERGQAMQLIHGKLVPAVLRNSFTPRVVEKTGPPVGITEQGDFTEAALRNGVSATREQCERLSGTVWAVAPTGESACLKYWAAGFSPGTAAPRALVYFHGDSWEGEGRTSRFYLNTKNEEQAAFAQASAARVAMPFILVARPGTYGSSGDHTQRRRPAESRIVSAGLDALKARFGIKELVVAGYSGGGHVTSSLLTLRNDIVCAVPGGAPSSPRIRWQLHQLTKDSTGHDDSYEPTEHLRKEAVHPRLRIFVVGDPRDRNGVWAAQVVMADKAREQGIAAAVIEGQGTGPTFHGGLGELTRRVAGWCGRDLSTDDIVRDAARQEGR